MFIRFYLPYISIIWQSTAGHTIENDPIWHYGANPNIAPWKLDKPFPSRKPNIRTKSEYESYLPTRTDFIPQLKLMYALTDTMDDTEDLTGFSHLWVDPTVVGYVHNFKWGIKNLENEISRSHESYPIPYDYILPSNVKARIDI